MKSENRTRRCATSHTIRFREQFKFRCRLADQIRAHGDGHVVLGAFYLSTFPFPIHTHPFFRDLPPPLPLFKGGGWKDHGAGETWFRRERSNLSAGCIRLPKQLWYCQRTGSLHSIRGADAVTRCRSQQRGVRSGHSRAYKARRVYPRDT